MKRYIDFKNRWGGFDSEPVGFREKIIRRFYWRINRRRERLLRKWGKTYYFTQTSIGEKLEVEYYSLIPNDGKWHNISVNVTSWAKKQPKRNRRKADHHIDGIKIAEVSVYGERPNNVQIGVKK